MSSVYEIISTSPEHTTLTKLIQKFHLVRVLKSSKEKFLVFAPTDAAFQALSPKIQDHIKNPQILKQVLLFHVKPLDSVKKPYKTKKTFVASNGIVRSISKVLLPKE